MKFKVERRDLIEALEPVSRLAKKLSSMEMLAHVKLEAYERLAVKATNLDTSESRVLDAEIEEAGQCTADTKKLLGLLKADRSDTVSFETASSEWIQLTTDGMSVKIRTLDAEQYPVFDENLKFWFDTAPGMLLTDIACVLNAADGGKGSKQLLETALLETKGGKIFVTAADCKIILRINREMVASEMKMLVPSSFLNLLPGSIKGESVIVGTSGENDSLICFHSDEYHISSRLYEGEFPDVDVVISPYSKNHTRTLTFNRADMEYVAEVMKPLATGIEKTVVKTRYENGKLRIAHRNDTGSLASEIEAHHVIGDNFEFFWQLKYMDKLLSGFAQHDEIFVGFRDALNPIYFKNAGELVTEGLIMPMKDISWMEDL